MLIRGHHFRTVPVALLATMVLGLGVPHATAAITLFTFRGFVRDAIGRPIAGVKISDGSSSNFAYSASDGSYSLPESNTGNYRLWATKRSIASTYRDKQVLVPTPEVPVDFDGTLYQIEGIMPKTAFSAVSSDSSTTLTLTNWAPSPSCVSVADSRGGGGPATWIANNADGSSTWRYQLDIPQGTAQGTYGLSYRALDCSNGTVITTTPSPLAYLVDNTAPVVDQESLMPAHGSNTAFLAQPLLAKITDTGGAGVKPSSIVFTLTDTTTGTSSVITNSYSSATRYATGTATLALGHSYRLVVTASDVVGNQATPVTAEFSALGVVAATATAKIPPTQSSNAGDVTPTTGTRTFTFSDLPLQLSQFTVSVSGPAAHHGVGYITQKADLTKARIRLYQEAPNGSYTELPAPLSPVTPAWGVRTMYAQYALLDKSAATTSIKTEPVFATLTDLTVEGSGLADMAVVDMSATTTPDVPVCENPRVGCDSADWPTPDPLPYHLADADAETLVHEWAKVVDQNADDFNRQKLVETVPACNYAGSGNCQWVLDRVPEGLMQILFLEPLSNSWSVVPSPSLAQQQAWWGLEYVQNYPIRAPQSYTSDCSLIPCTSRAASSNANYGGDGDEYECLNKDEKLVSDKKKNCSQWMSWGAWYGPDVRGRQNYHRGQGWMYFTIGVNDGDRDQFSLGASTGNELPGWVMGAEAHGSYRAWKLNDPDGHCCHSEAWMRDTNATCTVMHTYEPYTGYIRGYLQPQNGFLYMYGPAMDSSGYPFSGLHVSDRGQNDPGFPQHFEKLYYEDSFCAPNDYDRNFMGYISAIGTFFNGGFRNNPDGIFGVFYGHNRSRTNWNWGCGFGWDIVPPSWHPGFGCGWDPSVDDAQVWSASAYEGFVF